MFRIDSETGILYPKKSLHGQPRHFHLVVEGRDAGDLTDRATVDIDILNVNQNKPTFIMPASLNATVEVPEVLWMHFVVTSSFFFLFEKIRFQ